MINIGVFFWEFKEEYNKDIYTEDKSLLKICNSFDEPGGNIIVRELLSDLYFTGDIITIRSIQEGVIVNYIDYNNFNWDFSKNKSFNSGLSNTLDEYPEIELIKLNKGELLIKNITCEDIILYNFDESKEKIFKEHRVLSEVLYNIYHYEYIKLPKKMNINKYYKEKEKQIKSLVSDYSDLVNDLVSNKDNLLDCKPEHISILPQLKSLGFYW